MIGTKDESESEEKEHTIETEEEKSEEEQEEQQEPVLKRQKMTTGICPNEIFDVLPCPAIKADWTPPGVTTSMRKITNPHVAEFLKTIKMPLKTKKIRFKDIPEFESGVPMIGRFRFLLAKKNKKDEEGKFVPVFSVLPNVLVSEYKCLYYWAPNKEWFALCPGKGEKRRFDYHIPAPFSDRQNINTAVALNFA